MQVLKGDATPRTRVRLLRARGRSNDAESPDACSSSAPGRAIRAWSRCAACACSPRRTWSSTTAPRSPRCAGRARRPNASPSARRPNAPSRRTRSRCCSPKRRATATSVARLKWGDPFVFDSGAKEALFLHEQGVPFEVVPGVTSAVGAAAYAGIPLTHPDAGDAVVFIRGHEDEAGLDSPPRLARARGARRIDRVLGRPAARGRHPPLARGRRPVRSTMRRR